MKTLCVNFMIMLNRNKRLDATCRRLIFETIKAIGIFWIIDKITWLKIKEPWNKLYKRSVKTIQAIPLFRMIINLTVFSKRIMNIVGILKIYTKLAMCQGLTDTLKLEIMKSQQRLTDSQIKSLKNQFGKFSTPKPSKKEINDSGST